MRFDTPNGGEHIWMVNINLKDGKYFGEVGNLPEFTKEVKLGDVVQIPTDKISDWMYIDKDKLKGGYTIRVIRDGMNKTEKKKFDQEMGMIIE